MALSYLQAANDGANSSTYTFAGQSLGAAATDRHIIVAVHTIGAGDISSVTIAGVTATQVVMRDVSGSVHLVVALYIAAVPTGTSGSVVVNFSASMARCRINMWRATELVSATAVDTGSSIASAPTDGIVVPRKGFIIGATTTQSSNSPTHTWTNLTERDDAQSELLTYATAADATFNEGGTKTVTCTPSAATDDRAGVFASWRLPDPTTQIVMV